MFSALIFLSVFVIACVRIRRSFFDVSGSLSHGIFCGFCGIFGGLEIEHSFHKSAKRF